jgi:hypothetical protein
MMKVALLKGGPVFGVIDGCSEATSALDSESGILVCVGVIARSCKELDKDSISSMSGAIGAVVVQESKVQALRWSTSSKDRGRRV